MSPEKKKDFVILIPASEEKNEGGNLAPLGQPSKEVQYMVEALRRYRGDWERLLGVRGEALVAAIEANKNILLSPTMSAIERYCGEIYQQIDYFSLSDSARRFFDEHVRIVSPVFGLLKPREPIPNYRLRIDKLSAARYWRMILAEVLEDHYVIDLLPVVFKRAVPYEKGISVDFVIIKDGKEISAEPSTRAIKGRFVRFLCENKISDPKEFSQFDEDGFKWDWLVFVKRVQ